MGKNQNLFIWEHLDVKKGLVMFIEQEEDLRKVIENGSIFYYNKEGEFHRLDGPAAIYKSGNKFWMKNNKYHRLYGPAIEWWNGNKEYWIEGTQYSEKNYLEKIKEMNI